MKPVWRWYFPPFLGDHDEGFVKILFQIASIFSKLWSLRLESVYAESLSTCSESTSSFPTSTLSPRWVKLCLPGVKANCELIYLNTLSHFWLRLPLYFANAKEALRAVFVALRPRGSLMVFFALSCATSLRSTRCHFSAWIHDCSFLVLHEYIELQRV
jgi:hypothetical protein